MCENNASQSKPKETKGSGPINLSLPTASLPDTSFKVPKVRQAGHLVDQKLKYNDPTKSKTQPNLFNLLDPNTVGDVQGVEIKCEGIKLTVSEDRLINAIGDLLKNKSENKDTDSETFYKGNYESAEVVLFGGEKEIQTMFKNLIVKVLPILLLLFGPTSLVWAGQLMISAKNYSSKESKQILDSVEGAFTAPTAIGSARQSLEVDGVLNQICEPYFSNRPQSNRFLSIQNYEYSDTNSLSFNEVLVQTVERNRKTTYGLFFYDRKRPEFPVGCVIFKQTTLGGLGNLNWEIFYEKSLSTHFDKVKNLGAAILKSGIKIAADQWIAVDIKKVVRRSHAVD